MIADYQMTSDFGKDLLSAYVASNARCARPKFKRQTS